MADNNYEQGNYTYYQNLYSMFGGYNPIIDKKVSELRRLGMMAGGAAIGFVAMQYVFAVFLRLFNLTDLYLSDAVCRNAFETAGQILYIFVPFFLLYLASKPHEKEAMQIFHAPRSKQLFVLAVFAGFMICRLSDTATSMVNGLFSAFGVDFRTGIEDVELPSNMIGYILMVINFAVMPALLEEFAFRSVILQPLRKYGDRFAIVVSSLMFALLHGNMVQIPFAFVSGLTLSYFCITTGSIWTSVFIHFLNNFFSVVFSIYYDKHPDESTFLFFIVSAGIIIVGVFAFAVFRINYKKKLSKGGNDIGRALRVSAYVCAPTVVYTIYNAVFSSLRLTDISSGSGVLLMLALLAIVSYTLIKHILILRRDSRIKRSPAYTVSLVITVIAAFAGTLAIVTVPFIGDTVK